VDWFGQKLTDGRSEKNNLRQFLAELLRWINLLVRKVLVNYLINGTGLYRNWQLLMLFLKLAISLSLSSSDGDGGN